MMYAKKKIAVQKCVYAVPVETRPDQKNLMMWVRVEDLPDDLRLDPNARRADTESKVAKQIMATLRDAPETFWKLNSGIQMTARDAEIKDGRVATLDLFDPEDDDEVADGVINGGHTYQCILKVRSELAHAASSGDPMEREQQRNAAKAINNAIVRVEVLTGIERKELADISRARNTGEAVKKYSLQNLKRLYEPIKKELGPEECERIGFCENDVDLIPGKNYQVLDLIRLMSLFNNTLYPYGQDRHPVPCYSSASTLVDKWEAEPASYLPLVPKLRDLMKLHDQVYVMLSDWKEHQRGSRNGFDKKPKPVILPFTSAEVAYKVSNAFVYPILASLRILLDQNGNWKMNPTKFVATEGVALIACLMAFHDEQCKSKPHETGRSVGSWRQVAAEVRARFAEWMLAEQARA